jgi:hypothetical protein
MAAKRQELMISTVAQQSVPAGGMWVPADRPIIRWSWIGQVPETTLPSLQAFWQVWLAANAGHRAAVLSLLGGRPTEWYPGWVTLEPPPRGQRLRYQ